MKLGMYAVGTEEPRLGFFIEDAIVDANTLGRFSKQRIPTTLDSCLEQWSEIKVVLQEAWDGYAANPRKVQGWAEGEGLRLIHHRREVMLAPPVLKPQKILCCGVNYQDHVAENPNAVIPELPFFFAKLPSALIGDGAPIIIPEMSKAVDYEVEVSAVIGRAGKAIAEQDALSYLAGYMLFHDVSARDVQFKDQQITLGKNFDTFAPTGPYLVTPDEIPDINDLEVALYLNNHMLQHSSTKQWIFKLPYLIHVASKVCTLYPGDIITTGTPGGVGCFRQPPVYLQDGDVVRLEATHLGKLENPVRDRSV